MKHLIQPQKRIVFMLLAFLILSLAAFSQDSFKNGVRVGMVKVKFKPGMATTISQMKVKKRAGVLSTGIETFDAVSRQAKASDMYRLFDYDPKFETKLQKHGLDLWYVVEIDTALDPASVAQQFRSLGEISIAEVDYQKIISPYEVIKHTPGPVTYDLLPFNDPLLKDQWHYHNSGQLGMGDADVNLFKAWEKTTGSNDIIVAVHDEGVDVKHEDLKANMWVNLSEMNGLPRVDDDQNGYIDDIHGYNFALRKGTIDPGYHGTHVAGTIAAVNNNGKGVSGIAGGDGSGNGVKIMSLQIFGGNALIEKTFIYAANNGAVISQNSWGYSEPGTMEASLQDAIDYVVEEAGDFPGSPMKGGIVIFAAGNYASDDEWYPGYYHNTLSVASIGPEWKKTNYSNYGKWVDISAPGGDIELYGSKGGVLSTIPKNEYAYLEGTSMACPHVAGIAALALAHANKQLTSEGLWNILVTGVREIQDQNPDFIDMLGSGAIDASMVTLTDLSIPPDSVSTLEVSDIAQDFAILSWSVPDDEDDSRPLSFEVYFATQPITALNLPAASKLTLKNTKSAGELFEYELDNLLPLTTYYFAVKSLDRWGNISDISNIVSASTNNGPTISVDENSQSIELTIEASVSTTASHEIIISNLDEGLLRWDYFMRHKTATPDFNAVNIKYPAPGNAQGKTIIGRRGVHPSGQGTKTHKPVLSAFIPVNKELSSWPTDIIGETDIRLTNSAAGRFFVSEDQGFNLTDLTLYIKHDPVNGPIIIEIHKGTQYPNKNNLVFAQEYSNWSKTESFAQIVLEEQLFFEKGETFWVLYHVPSGNLFPIGIGFESSSDASNNCFISFDMGSQWQPLEEALASKDFAFVMVAQSNQDYLGSYISLAPESGDISAFSQDSTVLTLDGAGLTNGTYAASVILSSNDARQPLLRIPVNLTVTGHKPLLKQVDIIDLGAVFKGKSKTIEFLLENEGFGNYTITDFSVDNPQFTFPNGTPWQVKARSQEIVTVQFIPTQVGNVSGLLHISNGDSNLDIPVFGVGTETSEITVNPDIQHVYGLALGDMVNAKVTVSNTGKYPLKYFIPGFDLTGIGTNWPDDYHKYGYKVRSNMAAEINPIPYDFQDISSTGINITSFIKSEFKYYELDLGFDFPYYNRVMHTIYIANKGFTTFDDTFNPINIPNLNDPWSPKGYISVLGSHFNYEFTNGQVFYKTEPDRLIIQYDKVGDGYSGTITAQMVLFSDGNIRFYYDDLGYDSNSLGYLTICMEDYDQGDGIMVHDWSKPRELYSGFALGFDFPGPDIITGLTHGSGILMPGLSAVMDITIATDSLVEGFTNRYLNIISNDPQKSQTNPLIQLEIVTGGIARPVLSSDSIQFGEVLQGSVRSELITIKNTGTARSVINSVQWIKGDFIVEGEIPYTLRPGLYSVYKISVPSSVLGSFDDKLVFFYSNGTYDTLVVSAGVIPAPDLLADSSLLQYTLERGGVYEQAFSFENSGAGTLKACLSGKQWLSFTTETKAGSMDYTHEKHNTGGVYQWTDLYYNGGIHLPLAVDLMDSKQFYKSIALPFAFEFYGISYDSLKVGENGVVSFEQDPNVSFFTDTIPTTLYSGPAIMPCWAFGGFNTYLYNEEEIGIFYKADTHKVILQWRYLLDNFGMGDPFSFQLILFRNGSMKFLYKPEFDKMDAITGFGAIGLQENSKNGRMINDHMAVDHGEGLVYTVIPVQHFKLNPGENVTGNLVLDAQEVFAGIHTGNLQIVSNVPGKEIFSKPVELTVNGAVSLEMPDTVDFGKKIAYYDEYQAHSYTVELEFLNNGDTPVEITNIYMSDETQPLALMLYVEGTGWFPGYWDYVFNIFSPWVLETPVYKLMPGDMLKAKASFYPEFEGEYVNHVMLTASTGEMSFTLVGQAVAPPVMDVDKTPVEVTMIQPSETDDRIISFNNYAGSSELEYHISVEYFRVNPVIYSEEHYLPGDSASSLKSVSGSELNVIRPQPNGSYNRTLKHTDNDKPDEFLGTGGVAPFTLATKFNTGNRSFNLSHIETWFRPEILESGTITAEIRAGGTNIVNAQILAQGSAIFNNPDEDNDGYWLTIEFSNPALIYPGEDFYVVIKYPLGISYPQACDSRVEKASGRYLYNEEGAWYDLQEVIMFGQYGWMMAAHETTPVTDSWLTVSSDTSGIVLSGQDSGISLHFEGAYAQGGIQRANIIIESNDPYNSEVKVPVVLNLNDAPRFFNIPEEIMVSENLMRTIQVDVVDVEGHSFTVSTKEEYTQLTWSFADGILTIAFTPTYGSEGEYSYVFMAEDQYGASREQTISIQVEHSNQAPVYIGALDAFMFHIAQNLKEYSIGELFADPDGDEFTFTVYSENPELLKVFASQDGILIKTLAAGNTHLFFTLTDSEGAFNVISKAVSIGNGTGVKDKKVLTATCYPNPAHDKTTLILSGDISGTSQIRLLSAMGDNILYIAGVESLQEKELDLTSLSNGLYLVEVINSQGKHVIKIIKE